MLICPHRKLARIEGAHVIHDDGSTCIKLDLVLRCAEDIASSESMDAAYERLRRCIASAVRLGVDPYTIASYVIGFLMSKSGEDTFDSSLTIPRGSYGYAAYIEADPLPLSLTISSIFMSASSTEPLDVVCREALETVLLYVRRRIGIAMLHKIGFSGSIVAAYRRMREYGVALLLGNSLDIGLKAEELFHLLKRVAKRIAILDFESVKLFYSS